MLRAFPRCANKIMVRGVVEEDKVSIVVQDDGAGFEVGDSFTEMLAKGQYGLAGMHERASLIGGKLVIKSELKEGTTIRLDWLADEK